MTKRRRTKGSSNNQRWIKKTTKKIQKRQKKGKSPRLPKRLFADGNRNEIIVATLFGLESWWAVENARLGDLKDYSKEDQHELLREGQKRVVYFMNRMGRNLNKMDNADTIREAEKWYKKKLAAHDS